MNPGNTYIILAVLLCIYALEGAFPHYTGRGARLKHALTHVSAALTNGLIKWSALSALTIWAIERGRPLSAGFMNALPLGPALRTAAVFVAFDLWMYFWHLGNHRIGFLRRFHRAHHSDIAMDSTTALRFHPGELILSAFARLPALLLLGMSFAQLTSYELLLNLSILFHHSNLAVPKNWDRALSAVITTPDMHRIHHSSDPTETNSNFTSLLSVWDRLFGTFRAREDTRAIELGLPIFRGEKWQRFQGFIITPFQ